MQASRTFLNGLGRSSGRLPICPGLLLAFVRKQPLRRHKVKSKSPPIPLTGRADVSRQSQLLKPENIKT